MKRRSMLILTGSLGDGHNKAAQAIMEAAQNRYPELEVKVVDFLQWTHPYLHSFGRFCYMQWVKSLPSVYGYLYRNTREENKLSLWFRRLRSFSTSRMLELLEDTRPTEVVCTFPGAAAAMSYLKKSGLTAVPMTTVITDYTDHSYWVHPMTDRYLVGAEHVKQALLQRYGIQAEQVEVTGIPIRSHFHQPLDRDRLRLKHGLDLSMPTVLVMGGGHGMIGKEVTELIIHNRVTKPTQFIIVCGRNEKLKGQLEEQLAQIVTRHRVVVTGFVDYVHEFMALSDLIITKPGGLTVSEAIAMELPMLLYRPIPGQETENARFLVGAGAGVLASRPDQLEHQLNRLLTSTLELKSLKSSIRLLRRAEGAEQALSAILSTTAS